MGETQDIMSGIHHPAEEKTDARSLTHRVCHYWMEEDEEEEDDKG